MNSNRNRIEIDYKPTKTIISKLKNLSASNEYLHLYAEKSNDTIWSLFLFNNSTRGIEIPRAATTLYVIQEAIDDTGKWKPIEYFDYRFCGNSFSSINLKTKDVIKTKTIL